MIRILCIADEIDCIKIQSYLSIMPADSGEKIAVYHKGSREASWESYFSNPLMYDYIIVDFGENNNSLSGLIKKINEALKENKKLKIIFMTFRTYIPVQIFEVPHIHLLRRPLTIQRVRVLWDILTERIKCIVPEEDRMAVYQNKKVRFINRRNVLYVKKSRGGVNIVTDQGVINDQRRLDEFMLHNSEHFIRCHDSHAVNIIHVMMIDSDRVYLDSGEEFSISRARKKDVADYIANNIRKKCKKA